IEVNNPNEIEIESGIYNKGEIDLERIIQSVKKDPKFSEAGSIHTFTEIVRCSSKTGKPVIGMKIDAYNDLANESIKKICDKLKQEKGIIDVKIIHLKGEFELSEDLVYLVVASTHRKEGFEIISKAVDMYKKDIAVWKREDFKDGSSEWVH
ncbi:MAG: molybdenum cofactor biosynthesis protein MoaE, partial [Candidatus Lokiarchaeota archaeon]|nr:molybdenum cofactor biosynthesis protein MoaE [Candidatus Lokiarchaeota archaeon]